MNIASGLLQWLIPFISVLITAFVAILAMRRTDTREHHRWLQEKRREAYVDFLNSTRSTYEVISASQQVGLETSGEVSSRRVEDIERKMNEAKRARDVLAVVGPDSMDRLGLQVMARLRLGRIYFSSTRDSQLGSKDKILRIAEETGDPGLLKGVQAALHAEIADVSRYGEALSQHRLDGFWDTFTVEARNVLSVSRPGNSRTRSRPGAVSRF